MKDLILIADATQKQLFQYATVNLGLEVDESATVADLKELIATVSDDDSIEVDVEEKPKRKPAKKAVNAAPEIICITLAADQSNPTGKQQHVTVNGVSIWIPIGEKCHIPMKYYDALMDAKTEIFPTDSEGRIIGDAIVTPRFPISVHFGE
jgi:hypothetical protein